LGLRGAMLGISDPQKGEHREALHA
jgi:hypothetical protein